MKIALYIEDGLEQIVLTPKSETENSILGKLHDSERTLRIYQGVFYVCRGGWVRQREMFESREEDRSTIIVLNVKEKE